MNPSITKPTQYTLCFYFRSYLSNPVGLTSHSPTPFNLHVGDFIDPVHPEFFVQYDDPEPCEFYKVVAVKHTFQDSREYLLANCDVLLVPADLGSEGLLDN